MDERRLVSMTEGDFIRSEEVLFGDFGPPSYPWGSGISLRMVRVELSE